MSLITFIGKLFFVRKKRKLPDKIKNILVIRSGGIGDVLMTTPLIKAIKNKFPNSSITYLVGKWSKEILSNNKNIDNIISFDDNIIFRKNYSGMLKLIRKIKKNNYDLCLILDKHYMWNLFAFFCKIPFRIGFDRNGEGFPNNLNIKFDGSKYEPDYYLDIAKLLNINVKDSLMDLPISNKDELFAVNIIKKYNLKNRMIIGIAPGGAENPGQVMEIKRWPLNKYTELIKKLLLNKKISILLFGGANDKGICETIIKKTDDSRIINLAGKTNINQTATLMKKCRVIVTHDSGPMHIAGAVKSKLIALFGPTPAKRFAPKTAIIIKSKEKGCPCYDIYGNYSKSISAKCMDAIEVDEVYSKIKKQSK